MWNERILPCLAGSGAEAIFLTKQPNVRWATGFRGADTCALVTKTGAFLFTDPRYTEQAARECPDAALVNWRAVGGSLMKAVAHVLREQGLHSVAFEADALSYERYSELREETEAELLPAAGVVERQRSVKTPEEIDCLRAACDIACRAFWRILKDIRVGVTEKELAAKLSAYMVLEGADTQPYGNILISGPNTSLLHGIPSERALQYGDFVLMDYGCQFRGYMSDMTRTVVLGKAGAKQREVYALEQRMLEDALAAIRPGAAVGEVYEASVRAIRDTPYFPYHYSGVGHGVGLFVHEPPFMRPGGEDVLQKDMVTTIEPGLYLPGWGGVRIEDQVLLTDGGCEDLISVPHELMEL